MKEVKCDTCGKVVNEVRRIVVKKDYDRSLSVVIYNCLDCYEKKKQFLIKLEKDNDK